MGASKRRATAEKTYEIPPPPRHRRKYLTVPEWRKLYAAACDAGELERFVLYMMYRFCLRASEITRFRLEGLKALDRGMLYVFRGKGSAAGWVQDVTPEERRTIQAWVRKAYADPSQRVVSAPLFPARHAWRGGRARPLSRHAIYRIVQACGRAAGLPKEMAHPHAIRHGFIMHLIDRLIKKGYHHTEIIATVSKRTGHKAAKTLVEYYISETQAAGKEFQAFVAEMLKEGET